MNINNQEEVTTPTTENAEVNKVRAQLARLKAECVVESKNLQGLRRENVDAVAALEDTKKAIEFFQGEINKINERRTELSESLDQALKENEALEAKNKELKQTIKDETDALNKAKEDLKAEQERVVAEGNFVAEKADELAQKEAKLDEKIKQINSVLTAI